MPTIHEDLKNFYKGYQGACPEKAKFLFIGSDANFPADMSQGLFDDVKEYLEDGAKFWRNNKEGVHHPFLLSRHKKETREKEMGRRYHERFQKIGFKACHADLVSFLELFHRPTQDKGSKVKAEDLCSKHLTYIRDIITSGEEKFVFMGYTVASRMRETEEFSNLLSDGKCVYKSIKLLWKGGKSKIFKFHHFSSGRLKNEETDKMAEIMGVRGTSFTLR